MDKKFMLAMATSLIKENGRKCKITHLDGTVSSAYGVVTRASKGLAASTTVTEGGLVCLLQGTVKKVPAAGDIIRIGIVDYLISTVGRVQPDGSLTYLYALEVTQ